MYWIRERDRKRERERERKERETDNWTGGVNRTKLYIEREKREKVQKNELQHNTCEKCYFKCERSHQSSKAWRVTLEVE